MMQPPAAEAEEEKGAEKFAPDKVGHNTRTIYTWCARCRRAADSRARRGAHAPVLTPRLPPRLRAPPRLRCSRVASAIIAGCVAGIMGMEGLSGFLLFLVSCLVTSAMLCARMGSLGMLDYFAKPHAIWTAGLTDGLMSYILFWTLFFDLVHIF